MNELRIGALGLPVLTPVVASWLALRLKLFQAGVIQTVARQAPQ